MGQVVQALWSGWKAIAVKIGRVQTRWMLSLFYYVCMWPAGLGLRLLGDPLGLKSPGGRTRWRLRDHPTLDRERARRQ